ncbi:MAG: acyltransferase family protein, partial [Acidobacteriota bacterium]
QGSGDSASLFRLLHEPFFHHLWFLWFLCWYVAGFALCVWAGGRFGLGSTAGWRRIALSPFRWLWLVPVTALPQALMGRLAPVFGADTSAGLLPMPHVLVFYGLFFAFGALYFEAGDVEGKVGRGWFLTLPLGLFVLFPIGLGLTFSGLQNAEPAVRVAAALVQGAYPWVMLFGLMGLSRRVLGSHRPWVRYLSDASYWLYLAHLPLILGAQLLVRDWNLPASVKLTLVCVGVTVILMGIYRVAVRYTWLGRLLNGPRERPVRPAAPRPV